MTAETTTAPQPELLDAVRSSNALIIEQTEAFLSALVNGLSSVEYEVLRLRAQPGLEAPGSEELAEALSRAGLAEEEVRGLRATLDEAGEHTCPPADAGAEAADADEELGKALSRIIRLEKDLDDARSELTEARSATPAAEGDRKDAERLADELDVAQRQLDLSRHGRETDAQRISELVGTVAGLREELAEVTRTAAQDVAETRAAAARAGRAEALAVVHAAAAENPDLTLADAAEMVEAALTAQTTAPEQLPVGEAFDVPFSAPAADIEAGEGSGDSDESDDEEFQLPEGLSIDFAETNAGEDDTSNAAGAAVEAAGGAWGDTSEEETRPEPAEPEWGSHDTPAEVAADPLAGQSWFTEFDGGSDAPAEEEEQAGKIPADFSFFSTPPEKSEQQAAPAGF